MIAGLRCSVSPSTKVSKSANVIPEIISTLLTNALNDCWPDLIFPESEIAFIVLHFGGSIKNQGNRFLNILVVCS
ncbi:hypothetical protein CEJ90_15505, partial [Staphylococcus aureus]